jgi:hypothetical protein
MSEFDPNREIERLRRRKQRRAERLVLFFNRSAEILLKPFRWAAWRLWGKRRAIKRMQELAGLLPPTAKVGKGRRMSTTNIGPSRFVELEESQDDTGLN